MASYSESPEEARGRRELAAAAVFFLLALVVLYLPGGVQSQVAATFRAPLLRPFLFTQETLAQARLRAEEAGNLQTRLDSVEGNTTILGRVIFFSILFQLQRL